MKPSYLTRLAPACANRRRGPSRIPAAPRRPLTRLLLLGLIAPLLAGAASCFIAGAATCLFADTAGAVPTLPTLTPLHHPADPATPEPVAIPQAGLPLADSPLTFDTNLGLIERTTAQAVDEALQGITLEPGSDILLHPMTTSEGQWFVEDAIARLLSSRGYRVHLTRVEAPATTPPATGPNAGAAGGAPGGSLGDLVSGGNKSAATTDTLAGAANPAANPPAQTPPVDPAGSPGGPTSTTGPGRPNGQFQAQMQAAMAAGNAARDPGGAGQPVPFPDQAGLVLSYRIVEFGVTYHDSWRRGFLGPRMVERLASVDLYTRLVKGSAENVLWAGRGRAERLDIVPQSKLDLLEGRTYPFTRPVLQGRPLSRLAEPILVSGIITGLVFLFYSSQN